MRDGLGRHFVHAHCAALPTPYRHRQDHRRHRWRGAQDGEIWSNALWDISKALGRDKANKVILEGTFCYTPDTSFADAARVTVQSARLLYGRAAADQVTTAFEARKIL